MFRGLILLFMLATLEKPVKSRAATVDNLQVNGDAIVLGKFLDSKGKSGFPGQIYGVGADGRSMSFYGVGGLTNFTSLDWINVKNFGAIGNGVIDDTIAIKSAITFQGLTGIPVYFPVGSYKVTDTLILTNSCVLIGDLFSSRWFLSNNPSSINFYLTNKPGIKLSADLTHNTDSILIYGLCLNGLNSFGNSDGIDLIDNTQGGAIKHLLIEKSTIKDFPKFQFYSSTNSFDIRFLNSSLHNVERQASNIVYVDGFANTQFTFDDCWISPATTNIWGIYGNFGDIRFNGGTIAPINGANGIYVSGSLQIRGTHLEATQVTNTTGIQFIGRGAVIEPSTLAGFGEGLLIGDSFSNDSDNMEVGGDIFGNLTYDIHIKSSGNRKNVFIKPSGRLVNGSLPKIQDDRWSIDGIAEVFHGERLWNSLSIDPNYRVGFGIASPQAHFHFAGTTNGQALIEMQGTTFNSFWHYGTNEDNYIRGGKSGSTVFIQDSGVGNTIINQTGGFISLGTNKVGPEKLIIVGNIRFFDFLYSPLTNYTILGTDGDGKFIASPNALNYISNYFGKGTNTEFIVSTDGSTIHAHRAGVAVDFFTLGSSPSTDQNTNSGDYVSVIHPSLAAVNNSMFNIVGSYSKEVDTYSASWPSNSVVIDRRHNVIIVTYSTGTFTVNLPKVSSCQNREYTIKRGNTGQTVTISAFSGDTIDGAGTYSLSADYKAVTVISDGVTSWWTE